MAFPYKFESNFEVGSDSEWTATVGTQVSVESYKELARQRNWGVPYQGAFALQAVFGVDTDSYVRTTGLTITSGDVDDTRFMLYIGKDVEATVTTEVAIFQHLPAIAAVGLRIEAGGDIKFGIRSTSAALTTSPITLERGVYYTIELETDSTTTNTCTARIDELGIVVTTANASATASTTEGWLGVIGIGAGSLANVSGTVTLDKIAHDTNRIYGDAHRFASRQVLTKSGHAFVGPGRITDLTLVSGLGTDCVLDIYDTDSATIVPDTFVMRLTNNVSGESVMYNGQQPIVLHKGAYVVISGTDPRAVVSATAPAYSNEAALRSFAR